MPTEVGGFTRIHQQKNYYIGALHTLLDYTDRPTHWDVVAVGKDYVFYAKNLMGFEFEPKNNHTNKFELLKVIAYGSCFTGFALDTYAQMSEENITKGIECMKGDWVIVERLSADNKKESCLPVSEINGVEQILALGASRQTVYREVQPTDFPATYISELGKWEYKLDGHIYSEGQIVQPEKMLTDNKYNYGQYWQKLFPVFSSHQQSFVITDAEAVRGVSGGPIIDQATGRFIAVSTVALHPDNTPIPPGGNSEACLDCHYRWARHLGVTVTEIKSQLAANTDKYFSCQ